MSIFMDSFSFNLQSVAVNLCNSENQVHNDIVIKNNYTIVKTNY